MKNKILIFVLAAAMAVFGFYYQDKIDPRPEVAGISYDKKIKAEHGVPIQVVEAVDGDTATLINGERIRYIGIDTPEEVDKRKPVQCFAHEAAARNREIVEGKMIKFYKDVEAKDLYDRWLGFVYLLDGTFVNLELVREGYAFAYPYPPDISKSEEFRQAEEYARENKLGLWGGKCEITKLKSGRKQTNSVEQ